MVNRKQVLCHYSCMDHSPWHFCDQKWWFLLPQLLHFGRFIIIYNGLFSSKWVAHQIVHSNWTVQLWSCGNLRPSGPFSFLLAFSPSIHTTFLHAHNTDVTVQQYRIFRHILPVFLLKLKIKKKKKREICLLGEARIF